MLFLRRGLFFLDYFTVHIAYYVNVRYKILWGFVTVQIWFGITVSLGVLL